jgi:hypothetical protein
MFNSGLNLQLSLIDTTEYSKISVTKPIVGNLMTSQVLINVKMQIMKLNSMNDQRSNYIFIFLF